MIKGTGISNGIGIGKALLLENEKIDIRISMITDTDKEIERYRICREDFIADTQKRIEELSKRLGQRTSQILKNHIYIVKDVELNDGIECRIKSEKLCAEAAVDEACEMYIRLLSSMDDENMRQRALDIEDVKIRLLRLLMNIEGVDLTNLPENTVLIVNELPPSVTAVMDVANIAGIVTERGGITSHAAILAKALDIPCVLSAKSAGSSIMNGNTVIVDSTDGAVFANPDRETTEIYQRKQSEYKKKTEDLKLYKNRPTVTKDGRQFKLTANIGIPEDVLRMLESGGEGAGLFRTEFLFMNGNSVPDEEEQFEAYKKAAIMAKNKPVVIRTLDIGGDKDIPYMGLARESNPFLGYRAIRYCLGRTDIFIAQLRAILRASAYGNLKIMLPMITTLNEIFDVKSHLNNIKQDLSSKDIQYDREIELGVMIETPSASLIADILALEVDFFSIGTNDLIQYTIAVDRGNENVAYLYSPFHPSVLRSIRHIIRCAKEAGIPVCMCGEAAANSDMIPLLMAFGLNEFSVNPSGILELRKNIAAWTMEEAQSVAEDVMKLRTEIEIIGYFRGLNKK